METAWFFLIILMFTVWVALDGFDFGAGIVHLFVARNDEERRTVLAAIGPVWDGNEVWLIAAGGTLVFAFPRAYAAAFSGFYLPLMITLWLLVLRGISIEFRTHNQSPLWRDFWDATFALASATLALVLGVALGNVIRGVPLDQSGYFHGELFTNFRVGQDPGAIDWYTLSVGLFALAALGLHGALYLNWKTDGVVRERSERLARRLLVVVIALGVLATALTQWVQPVLFHDLVGRPLAWPLGTIALLGFVVIGISLSRKWELPAFVGSGMVLCGLLGATGCALYPTLLRSSIDPGYSLTIANSATSNHGLAMGLLWWVPALLIALGYFVYLFRSFAGKVQADHYGDHE